MFLLLLVSVIWSFSFGLVKKLGGLDPTAVAAVRLAVSLVLFVPIFKPATVARSARLRLFLIGTVQFGVMYILYLRSYAHLHAYEVALFTLTTPIFIALGDAMLARRLVSRYLFAAAFSVVGAAIVVGGNLGDSGVLTGFLLVQLSNVCFAAGQLAWRREFRQADGIRRDAAVFALPLAGALALTLVVSIFTTNWGGFAPTGTQWAIIAYLGAVASGIGFLLWNIGATRVNGGVLAAFNNAKVPLGIACSLIVFGEHADLGRLAVGAALMAYGVWVAGD